MDDTSRRLEQIEQRYQSLWQYSLDGVFSVDRTGRFTAANPAAAAISGYSVEELLGLNFQQICAPDQLDRTLAQFQRGLSGHSEAMETAMFAKDGRRVELLLMGGPLVVDGQVEGIFCFAKDITARKRGQEALRRANEELETRVAQRTAELQQLNEQLQQELSERRRAEAELRNVTALARCLLWSADIRVPEDPAQRLIWIGHVADPDGAQQVLPLDVPEGKTYADAWSASRLPEDGVRMDATSDAAVRNGRSGYSQEFRCRDKFGDIRWLHEDVHLVSLGPGHWRSVGVCTDVTDRRRIEEALGQSVQRYRNLYEAVAGGIVVQDRSGRITEANPAACEMLGLTLDQMLGRNSADPRWQAMHEDGSPFPGEQHPAMEALRTGRPVRNVVMGIRNPQWNRHRWLLINAQPMLGEQSGQVEAVMATFVDITRQKQAEDALRESEQRYRTLFTAMAEGFALHEVILDDAGRLVDYRFLEVNAAFERLTGLASGAVVGRTARELFPDIEPFWIETYGRVALTGEPAAFHRFFPALDRHYQVSAFCPSPGRFAILCLDVTETTRAAAALRDSEERYRLLAENGSDMISRLDVEARFLYVSPASHALLDYRPEELLGRSAYDLIHPDDHAAARTAQATLLRGQEPPGVMLRLRRRDGSYVHVEVATRPVRGAAGPVVELHTATRDVTERVLAAQRVTRLLEEAIRAQEEERKRISRELHDETGQALTSLLVGLRSIEDLGELSAVRQRVGELRGLVQGTIEGVRRLATGLRPSVLDDLGLAAAVERLAAEYARAHAIRVQVEAGSLQGLRLSPPVEIAVYRIVQEALTNAARHAHARSARVQFQCEDCEDGAPSALRVHIEDDGRGFDTQDLQRASDGSDHLGLHSMRERATLLGGELAIKSAPGRGTRIHVRIPLSPGALAGPAPRQQTQV